uniref:Uncharacterized protein n=1 Tax=Arundo donax TaxID=35708 RepID=A0A0A9FBD0_ARUDO
MYSAHILKDFSMARFILPTVLVKFVVILMWNKLGSKQKP